MLQNTDQLGQWTRNNKKILYILIKHSCIIPFPEKLRRYCKKIIESINPVCRCSLKGKQDHRMNKQKYIIQIKKSLLIWKRLVILNTYLE